MLERVLPLCGDDIKTDRLHFWPEKKEKGPVEPEKEKEKEELEVFFCHLFEFHNPVAVASVPVEPPTRHTVNFVPAASVSDFASDESSSGFVSDESVSDLPAFHNPAVSAVFPPIPVAPAFIPAELPPRYAISFVPAAPPVVSSPVVSPTADCSGISYVNFVVPPSSTSPSTCIETT